MAPRGNGAASGLFGSYRTPDVPLHQYAPPPTTYTPNHSSGVPYYNTGRYSVSPLSNCPPLERLQPAAMGYPGDIPDSIHNGSNFNGALHGSNIWGTSPTNPGLTAEALGGCKEIISRNWKGEKILRKKEKETTKETEHKKAESQSRITSQNMLCKSNDAENSQNVTASLKPRALEFE
ncbi:uncharacterized protein NPIL_235021 [Nephila pilipes]|uniref:Uncharacterized protein n=1 Tax=Nephila pilipes TaxID=299642 RepID=A0A8X6M8B0_NEPPI|nr:uncharacterized protein NPIL_235021 [Nephila pilipes]